MGGNGQNHFALLGKCQKCQIAIMKHEYARIKIAHRGAYVVGLISIVKIFALLGRKLIRMSQYFQKCFNF